MIIWINGSFGVGKSSAAKALSEKIFASFIYDPEQFGYFLWDNFPEGLKRCGDFQDLEIWREGNYKILKHIADSFGGIIIVPMTICNPKYFDEIIGRLIQDKIEVKHFILEASKKTLSSRLKQRGDKEDTWAFNQADRCIEAFENEIIGRKIHTENKSIEEITAEILADLGINLRGLA